MDRKPEYSTMVNESHAMFPSEYAFRVSGMSETQGIQYKTAKSMAWYIMDMLSQIISRNFGKQVRSMIRLNTKKGDNTKTVWRISDYKEDPDNGYMFVLKSSRQNQGDYSLKVSDIDVDMTSKSSYFPKELNDLQPNGSTHLEFHTDSDEPKTVVIRITDHFEQMSQVDYGHLLPSSHRREEDLKDVVMSFVIGNFKVDVNNRFGWSKLNFAIASGRWCEIPSADVTQEAWKDFSTYGPFYVKNHPKAEISQSEAGHWLRKVESIFGIGEQNLMKLFINDGLDSSDDEIVPCNPSWDVQELMYNNKWYYKPDKDNEWDIRYAFPNKITAIRTICQMMGSVCLCYIPEIAPSDTPEDKRYGNYKKPVIIANHGPYRIPTHNGKETTPKGTRIADGYEWVYSAFDEQGNPNEVFQDLDLAKQFAEALGKKIVAEITDANGVNVNRSFLGAESNHIVDSQHGEVDAIKKNNDDYDFFQLYADKKDVPYNTWRFDDKGNPITNEYAGDEARFPSIQSSKKARRNDAGNWREGDFSDDTINTLESVLNKWCNLLEGIGPETADGSAYWHCDENPDFEQDEITESTMGTVHYRKKHPEESLYNQTINVTFDDEAEMERDNEILMSNGIQPLEEGDNWLEPEALQAVCQLLGMSSKRIKSDRRTVISVTVNNPEA